MMKTAGSLKSLIAICLSVMIAGCGGGGSDTTGGNTGSTTVSNTTPVANAGTDQSVAAGSLVTLDGSASRDADGDQLSYSWIFTLKPAGSSAALSSSTAVKPTFTADKAGSYVLYLVVNDGKVNSYPATVMVTAAAANTAPVANAGSAQSVTTGSLVTLSGSGSSDANGDTLTYLWSFSSKPSGSSAALSGSTTAAPTFTADVAGSYVISLVVNDGTVSSPAAAVTVTAEAITTGSVTVTW